jgi:hypothetical protein
MKLLKLAKKYKVRVTIRKGSRVYKSVRVLKKQLKLKMKKHKRIHRKAPRKTMKRSKYSRRRTKMVRHRRHRFGETLQQSAAVYRDFFGAKEPANLGPEWNCNMQSDGSCYMVGGPFYKY